MHSCGLSCYNIRADYRADRRPLHLLFSKPLPTYPDNCVPAKSGVLAASSFPPSYGFSSFAGFLCCPFFLFHSVSASLCTYMYSPFRQDLARDQPIPFQTEAEARSPHGGQPPAYRFPPRFQDPKTRFLTKKQCFQHPSNLLRSDWSSCTFWLKKLENRLLPKMHCKTNHVAPYDSLGRRRFRCERRSMTLLPPAQTTLVSSYHRVLSRVCHGTSYPRVRNSTSQVHPQSEC